MPFGFFNPGAASNISGLTGVDPATDRYFREYDAAMSPALAAGKRRAEDAYNATVDMTEAALADVATRQNPIPPMAVPQIDPISTALAGLFAGMHQRQTGSGQLPALVQNTLASQMAGQQQAVEANVASDRMFAAQKAKDTEGLHMDLLKAKRDLAMETGNLDEAFQHNKALYALERRQKQEAAKAAADAAAAMEGTKQAGRIALIEKRGEQARKTAGVVARLKKDAESRATTPAQKARLALANAQVGEIRAAMDDMRGARDLAGEAVYGAEELTAAEAEAQSRIEEIYRDAIAEFEAGKEGTVGGGAAAEKQTTETRQTPSNDRVKAAADRLRGTSLFQ